VKADNRYVVPYNPRLLLEFDSHINVEMCGTVRAVKYIFKYVFKVSLQYTLKNWLAGIRQGHRRDGAELRDSGWIADGTTTRHDDGGPSACAIGRPLHNKRARGQWEKV